MNMDRVSGLENQYAKRQSPSGERPAGDHNALLRLNSKFDDAEYERWSANLRASSKARANAQRRQ